MTSSLSAALLADIQATGRTAWSFDVTIGASSLRFAREGSPLYSIANGVYLPYVRSIGDTDVTLGFPSGGQSVPRVTAVVYDAERALQKAHSAATRVKGGATALTLRTTNLAVAEADHYEELSGIIHDWRSPEDRHYEYVFGPDDSPIAGPEATFNIPRLSTAHWPRVPAENLDAAGRAVFGTWSSIGVPGATGMVKAILVDPDNGIWYVSHGTEDDVPRIWVNGVTDTQWNVHGTRASSSPYTVSGQPYTIIEDTASTLRTVSDTVTVDVDGPEKNGDGSGGSTLLTAPAQMLETILANYAWNEWPLNALSSSLGFRFFLVGGTPGSGKVTPFDTTARLTADGLLGNQNHTASIIITSDTAVKSFVETWATSFQAYVSWNSAMKLTPVVLPIHQKDIYTSNAVRKDTRQILGTLGQSTLGGDVYSKVTMGYIMNASTGSLVRTRISHDSLNPDLRKGDFDYTYGPANSAA